jgi:nucleotide-binding universal stress UspA family protein
MTDLNRSSWPILVGVDGSDSAVSAVRWAAAEARRRRVGLRLVEALDSPSAVSAPQWAVEAGVLERHQQMARDRVAVGATAAAEVAPEVPVTTEVVSGHAVECLRAEAGRAQLAVLGHRGIGGLAGLVVGSTAVALAAHANCPVVVVRGAGPVDGDGPVVVGVDGSPMSEAALEFAFDEADRRRARLVAVHAWHDLVLDPWFAPMIDWDVLAADERQLLAQRLAGWGAKYPDVQVERVVVKDRPAHALQARSVGAQLLVVGSRGRGGASGMLLGSVSQALLGHAECPVAIVRPVPASVE